MHHTHTFTSINSISRRRFLSRAFPHALGAAGALAAAPAVIHRWPVDAGSGDWPRFTRALAAVLHDLDDGTVLILRSRARPYFVQFCRYGAAVRMEAVSNHYLAGDARLSAPLHRVLLMAGWQSPTHEADSPWPDLAGSPNYHRDIPHPSAAHDMAALAVQALRTVYGAPTPAALTYKAVALDGTVIRLPTLGVARRRA